MRICARRANGLSDSLRTFQWPLNTNVRNVVVPRKEFLKDPGVRNSSEKGKDSEQLRG